MRHHCTLVFLCAVAACASQGSEAAERQVDTSGRRDSIAAVAAASMSEDQVIGLLANVHATDNALGALGAGRGSTREIKDFGLMISREHVALHRDAQQLADGLRLTAREPAIIDEAPASFRVALDSSSAGAAWDRAYIEYAIAMHEAAMENTARALAATKSPAVRDYVRKSVPILQKHLDKARSLQKAMIEAQPAQAPDGAPARQDTNGD